MGGGGGGGGSWERGMGMGGGWGAICRKISGCWCTWEGAGGSAM